MYVHDKVRARMRDAKVRTWGHEPRPPPPSFVYSFETHQSADDAHTRHDYFFENTYFFPPQKLSYSSQYFQAVSYFYFSTQIRVPIFPKTPLH